MFQRRRPRPMNQTNYRHQSIQPMFQQHRYPSRPMQPNRYVQPQRQPEYHAHQQKKPSVIKSAFLDEHGSFDMGRTFQTMDQVMKTVNQASPIIKQVSSFFIKR